MRGPLTRWPLTNPHEPRLPAPGSEAESQHRFCPYNNDSNTTTNNSKTTTTTTATATTTTTNDNNDNDNNDNH